MNSFEVLLTALCIDLLIGDPRWFPHPVRLIGLAITGLEKILRKIFPPLIGGAVLTVFIVGTTFLGAYYLEGFLRGLPFGDWATAFLVSTTIALKGLTGEARKVLAHLKNGSPEALESARGALLALVGRDTAALDGKGVIRAVIESLAENASDGVIAPVFYYAIGGFPLAMAYKAVNTLDSMVGYRNERYILFGKASARLDDIANYIPARLTGFFISIAAFLPGLDMKKAFTIMLADGGKHPSPNSGVPMAAMAGALDLTLGGPAVYGGRLVDKPFIGNGGIPLSEVSGSKAVRLAFLSSVLGAILLGAGTLI